MGNQTQPTTIQLSKPRKVSNQVTYTHQTGAFDTIGEAYEFGIHSGSKVWRVIKSSKSGKFYVLTVGK